MAKHVPYLYEETNAHCPNTAVELLVQEKYYILYSEMIPINTYQLKNSFF